MVMLALLGVWGIYHASNPVLHLEVFCVGVLLLGIAESKTKQGSSQFSYQVLLNFVLGLAIAFCSSWFFIEIVNPMMSGFDLQLWPLVSID